MSIHVDICVYFSPYESQWLLIGFIVSENTGGWKPFKRWGFQSYRLFVVQSAARQRKHDETR